MAPDAAIHGTWKPEDSDPSSLFLTSAKNSPTASDILIGTKQPNPAATKSRKIRMKLNAPAGGLQQLYFSPRHDRCYSQNHRADIGSTNPQ